MSKKYFFLFTLMLSSSLHAWVCPLNFKQINPGDPLADVEKSCGPPINKKTYSSEVPHSGPEEWQYYVAMPSTGSPSPGVPALPTESAPSIKMTILLNNNKVVNITVQGMSLASTPLCGGSVSIDDTGEAVKAACGSPSIVSSNQNSEPKPKPNEITELKYNAVPPNTLVFENGKLKSRY